MFYYLILCGRNALIRNGSLIWPEATVLYLNQRHADFWFALVAFVDKHLRLLVVIFILDLVLNFTWIITSMDYHFHFFWCWKSRLAARTFQCCTWNLKNIVSTKKSSIIIKEKELLNQGVTWFQSKIFSQSSTSCFCSTNFTYQSSTTNFLKYLLVHLIWLADTSKMTLTATNGDDSSRKNTVLAVVLSLSGVVLLALAAFFVWDKLFRNKGSSNSQVFLLLSVWQEKNEHFSVNPCANLNTNYSCKSSEISESSKVHLIWLKYPSESSPRQENGGWNQAQQRIECHSLWLQHDSLLHWQFRELG